jgi:hypothetical protein
VAADLPDGRAQRGHHRPAVEDVLRPVFHPLRQRAIPPPAGDVIRGIDWLGNGGFVRNLVEKARDHRNNRLDTGELDQLLAWTPSPSATNCCNGFGS